MPRGSGRPRSWFHAIAARRLGMKLEDYTAKIATHAWCYRCRRWREHRRFGPDKSRPSGRDGTCIECRSEIDHRRPSRGDVRSRHDVDCEAFAEE